MPNSTVCPSFDFDALSVWFGYERTTPAMLARGEYGARVGVPRILALLAEHRLPATFFVPGHTAESFPRETEAILEAGHESPTTRTDMSTRAPRAPPRMGRHGASAPDARADRRPAARLPLAVG